MRPGRHSLSELHARPTQPEPGLRLTSVLDATDIPVTAGFWPLHAACASALTSHARPARQLVPSGVVSARGAYARAGRGARASGWDCRVTSVTSPLAPQSGWGRGLLTNTTSSRLASLVIFLIKREVTELSEIPYLQVRARRFTVTPHSFGNFSRRCARMLPSLFLSELAAFGRRRFSDYKERRRIDLRPHWRA